MLNLIEWKRTNNISNNTIEWKSYGNERDTYGYWLKWVTEKTLNKQFDEDEKKEVFGILMNLEEDATGGEFKAAKYDSDGEFTELLKAQGEHFKDKGEFVFSNSHLFPYLDPDNPLEPIADKRKKHDTSTTLPASKRRRTQPKGGKKTRKSKKKTRKPKRRTRKSKTKSRKNI